MKAFILYFVFWSIGSNCFSQNCNSELNFVSIEPSEIDYGYYDLEVELCIAGGTDGVNTGAIGPTRRFAFTFNCPSGFSILSFSPTNFNSVTTGDPTSGINVGPQASFNNADLMIFYNQPNSIISCIDSEINCGLPAVYCYNFTFTCNSIPDSIRAWGIEGDNNLVGGCTGSNMLINMEAIALNVTWNSITANLLNNNEVIITWETASEVNNDYFEVQKTINPGLIWNTIATVNGNGTTSLNHYYSSIDEEFRNELTYYRIQQTDFDGKKTWSKIVTVEKSGEYDYLLFPNPASNNVTTSNVKDTRILLFSLNGKLIQEFYSHFNEYQFDVSILENGIYILELLKGKELQREKLIIQH